MRLSILLLFVGVVFSYTMIPDLDLGEEILLSNSTKLTGLLSWVYNNSETLDFQIRDFTEMDRGIIPLQPIKANDIMMKISLDNVICRKTALEMVSFEQKEQLSGLSDDELLAIFMILQKSLEKKSKWFYYIDTLPKHIDLPATYTQEQINLIEDPFMKEYVLFLKRERSLLFTKYQSMIASLLSEYDIPFSALLWGTSFDALNWGLNIVYSRHITIQGNYYLIPLMDFRNYVASGNPFDKQDKHIDQYHEIQNNYLVIRAQKNFKVNRPITLDYEGYPNHYYFIHYNFVPKSNPYDCLLISLPPFNVTSERKERINTILSKWNVQEEMPMCYDATRHMNDPMLVYLALSTAHLDTLDRCIRTDGSMIETPPAPGMQVGGMHEAVDERGDWSIERKRQCVTSRKQEKHPETWEEKSKELKKILREYMNNLYQQFTTTISQDYYILYQNGRKNPDNIPIRWRNSRKLLFNLAFEALPQTESLPDYIKNRKEHRTVNDTSMDYDQWVRLHANYTHITLSDTAWETFGVYSSKDFQRGEEAFGIKDNGVLSLDYVFNDTTLGYELRNLYINQTIPEDAILALYLIYILDIKETSHDLYPLVNLLPNVESMKVPTLLSDSDLIVLYGSPLYKDILDIRGNIEYLYLKISNALPKTQILKKYFKSSILTETRFKWAVLTIDAQTLIFEGHRILLPYYSFAESSLHQTVGQLPIIRHINDTYYLYANDPSEKSREFFVTYGEPNWYTFLYKGITVPSVRNDCYKFILHLDQTDPLYIKKSNKLHSYNLPLYKSFCLHENYDDNNPDFIAMYNILHNIDPDMKKEGYTLLLKDIHRLYHGYLTPLVSDKRNARRGLLHERLNEVTRYMTIEKELLNSIRKDLAKYLNIKKIN